MGNNKIQLAVNWAGACGGCDVSILDVEDRILDLAAVADIVFWPVAVDAKRADFAALPDASVDVGLFNGVVRTSEQEEDARIMRKKCKVLVAYGACACFGGVPGLANLADREEILDVAYRTTPSTDNPENVRPQVRTPTPLGDLTLPAFQESVRALHQVVDVDYFLPGCPPVEASVLAAVGLILAVASGGELPEKGASLSSDKPLCDECPRAATRTGRRMDRVARPHQVAADPEICFLEQGLLCMGPFTAGGCEGTCIRINMPCRGCYGPARGLLDPGAEAASSIGSIAGPAQPDDLPRGEIRRPVTSIQDPAGTFYRFTLPVALIGRRVKDGR